MTKVNLANVLLELGWAMNLEGAPMRHPRDISFMLGQGENVVNLFGKGHLGDIRDGFVVGSRWDLGEVRVRVVHRSFRSDNGLDKDRLAWELRLVIVTALRGGRLAIDTHGDDRAGRIVVKVDDE